ncbi:NAD-dependent epimerase/dehydratase family protein [Blastococcus sp. TF02A-30]|uniref:NAD-dependent epimerase/dehydratase family protein n=1 Tax=Blastococcus sp. TF02A-30 TaxID=2250580 RepID=UPI000DEA9948|nr:NAD-dependent epimerase/dehydratase family protein [Blastococcus sp. TF02A-30]RBY84542.1 UDP-glucose 4-epimerase [Blastococcus sp. TF02A-30]
MTVLITGVAGFVGSALARRLLAAGESVVGVDSLTDYYDPGLKKENLATIPGEGFTFVGQDLNTADLDALLAGVQVVFHEAGQPGVRKSWGEDFATYVDANVLATQRLLEAARRAPDLRRLVYASSSSVYGNAQVYPTSEDDVPSPHSPYGVTKLAAEHLCTLYARNFDVPTVSLRYFTVYGPGQRPDMAFNRFIRAALAGRPIEVYGSGEQIRDFTFVDDVVTANLLAATNPVPPGAVFNVSGGTSISVNEVLDVLSGIAGRRLDVRRTEAVAGDVVRTGGSADRIRRQLGWEPTVDVESGLRAQWRSLGGDA